MRLHCPAQFVISTFHWIGEFDPAGAAVLLNRNGGITNVSLREVLEECSCRS